MHHPTDRMTHTTAFVTPVVEHWLEREIAQWANDRICFVRNMNAVPFHPSLALLRLLQTPVGLLVLPCTIQSRTLLEVAMSSSSSTGWQSSYRQCVVVDHGINHHLAINTPYTLSCTDICFFIVNLSFRLR